MANFDPRQHLRKLSGKEYLDVKWRIKWCLEEHPDASIESDLIDHDRENGFALFRATVDIPGVGRSIDYGSETKQDFRDYLEKASTKAIGRTLALRGYGTQFCDDYDFAEGAPENHNVVDAPVEKPIRSDKPSQSNSQGSAKVASESQIKLIRKRADEKKVDLNEILAAKFGGKEVGNLTVSEASSLINELGTIKVVS